MPNENDAVNAVKDVTPDGSKFRVTGTVKDVLDGVLFVVEYNHQVNVWDEKFAIFRADGVQVIASAESLAQEFQDGALSPQ